VAATLFERVNNLLTKPWVGQNKKNEDITLLILERSIKSAETFIYANDHLLDPIQLAVLYNMVNSLAVIEDGFQEIFLTVKEKISVSLITIFYFSAAMRSYGYDFRSAGDKKNARRTGSILTKLITFLKMGRDGAER
jgi:hypothetical protein